MTAPYVPATGWIRQAQVTALSRWIDEAPTNTGRNAEAVTWHRVAKVAEEAGEAIAALIGVTGGNPRKGYSHTIDDVRKELLDTALAALCAVEHLGGNRGGTLAALAAHIDDIVARAGLTGAPE